MIQFDHLLGVPFQHGLNDCYELCRRFYRDNFGLELTNYARPDNWWNLGMDLYMENFRNEGFKAIDVHPREISVGDAFLMAIRSKQANHAAIYVGEGKILHHVYGRFSNVEPYHGIWKNTTVAHLRHPTVFEGIKSVKPKTLTKLDLMELLPPQMKQFLEQHHGPLPTSDGQ